MADAALGFYPWLRRGLGAGVSRSDGDVAASAPTTKLGLKVEMFRRPVEQDGETANVTLSLIGPGDIVGLNSATVIRTFPSANESDAEFGNFAYVEFDQLDLPWAVVREHAFVKGEVC